MQSAGLTILDPKASPMILNVNDDHFCEAPTPATLKDELQGLGPDEFAILGASDHHYMQTYRNDDDTFLLEYREGSADAHFGIPEPIGNLAEILRAFSLYLQGDLQWKSLWNWQQIEFSDEDFLNHDNAYVIDGEVYSKIPCGAETYRSAFNLPVCPECGAATGEFHDLGCSLEQCPCCGEPNHSCDCE